MTAVPASPRRSSGGTVIPPELARAFAPLHKRAFGTAVGLAAGLALALATVLAVLRGTDIGLHLLDEYFYGYAVSWSGAVVGLLWGFFVGFVGGWFMAFCRNLALAISMFISRTRGELDATADFLDHI